MIIQVDGVNDSDSDGDDDDDFGDDQDEEENERTVNQELEEEQVPEVKELHMTVNIMQNANVWLTLIELQGSRMLKDYD